MQQQRQKIECPAWDQLKDLPWAKCKFIKENSIKIMLESYPGDRLWKILNVRQWNFNLTLEKQVDTEDQGGKGEMLLDQGLRNV